LIPGTGLHPRRLSAASALFRPDAALPSPQALTGFNHALRRSQGWHEELSMEDGIKIAYLSLNEFRTPSHQRQATFLNQHKQEER
jgi:hypothetical protein